MYFGVDEIKDIEIFSILKFPSITIPPGNVRIVQHGCKDACITFAIDNVSTCNKCKSKCGFIVDTFNADKYPHACKIFK